MEGCEGIEEALYPLQVLVVVQFEEPCRIEVQLEYVAPESLGVRHAQYPGFSSQNLFISSCSFARVSW